MEINKARESVPGKKNKEIKISGERKATSEVSDNSSSLRKLEKGDLSKDPVTILKEPAYFKATCRLPSPSLRPSRCLASGLEKSC